LLVPLDVGEADQDDPLAPTTLHFDAIQGNLGQQVPALTTALISGGEPFCVPDHARPPWALAGADSLKPSLIMRV